MVYLCDIMDLDLLDEMIEQGYVTARPHKDRPWVILNYTPKAQYDWKWNEVTVACRGLVYETDERGVRGKVIARPFEKFFNWDQGVGNEAWQNPMPPTGPVVRMEKMDGSLGILCAEFDRGEPTFEWIATRGSFHSEQAEWATKFYIQTVETQINEGYYENSFVPKQGKTYLFEIIYPENRIVVDYGEYKGLVLIDVIDNETGKADLQEFDDCLWPDKVKRVHLLTGFDSGQAAEIPPGDEGFVYYWPYYNFRTKMKSAEYIELHRLVSHLSEKSIWEALVAGKTLGDIKNGLPDEFHGFVDEVGNRLMSAAAEIMIQVAREFYALKWKFPDYERPYDVPRKDMAREIVKSVNRKYLFAMLDQKDIYPMALQAVKPTADKPLVSEEDI